MASKKNNVSKNKSRKMRCVRIRAKIKGTADCPRLSVFRSLKNISVQLIDDNTGKTICQASSKEMEKSKAKVEGREGKIAVAYLTGKKIAERAKEKGVEEIVFDRGGYRYHGRVAGIAEGAREGGLKF